MPRPMRFLTRLFESKPDPRDAVQPLWRAVVAEARRPQWYRDRGVEDSVTGRFDMVSMVTAVVLLRLEGRPELAPVNTLLTECFIEDMDSQLREFGVNDVVVGKRVGRLVGSLGGRLGALRQALPQGTQAVAEVIARNMRLTEGTAPRPVAEGLVALASRLARIDDAALLAGRFGQDEAA